MSAQIIEKNGTPEYAVLPYDEYRALLEKAEIAEDIAAYDEAMKDQSIAIPFEITEALQDGENPLKVWRKYCGMSQAALAALSGTYQSTIAQIESGQRKDCSGSDSIEKVIICYYSDQGYLAPLVH